MTTSTIRQKVCGYPPVRSKMPHEYCPGCHYGILTRAICEVVDEMGIADKTALLVGVGCMGPSGFYFDLDAIQVLHGRAPAVGTGLKRVLGDASVVMTVQGDGDLGSIGLDCFMHAAMRGEKLTTIFTNNAAYGMTGGQMAPTTLPGMYTTTTQNGRDIKLTGRPLHVAELAASLRGVAYSARVSLHTAPNFQKAKKALRTAIQKQVDGVGYSLVEFLSACPSSWKLSPVESLKAMDEKMIREYPLGEFKNVDVLV